MILLRKYLLPSRIFKEKNLLLMKIRAIISQQKISLQLIEGEILLLLITPIIIPSKINQNRKINMILSISKGILVLLKNLLSNKKISNQRKLIFSRYHHNKIALDQEIGHGLSKNDLIFIIFYISLPT